jgi:peptidoglycan hydrolase CwlO-like protein
MSIDDLQEQVEKFKTEMDTLEEVCDTLPECKKEDSCETCETYKKIDALNVKIAELEEKIESILSEDDDYDDDD